jgi:hypothetical protein
LATLQQNKPRQIFMKQCQLQIVNNSKKMEKQKRTLVKAREKEAIDYSNEIYLMLHVFFRFKQPNNSQNKF